MFKCTYVVGCVIFSAEELVTFSSDNHSALQKDVNIPPVCGKINILGIGNSQQIFYIVVSEWRATLKRISRGNSTKGATLLTGPRRIMRFTHASRD